MTMFNKTATTDFFSTININLFFDSLYYLTFWLPKLRKWDNNEKLKIELKSYLWILDSKIINFYNWRSALYHCLKWMWLKKTDEVIVNAYTCVSVINSIQQTWVKVKYSDINLNNYGFLYKDLVNNITKKTKVIVVQHTFWKNSNIEKIIALAKKNNILIIEDCCHSLWTKTNWKHLWSFWDFAIFSTGRDKVISSVTWGFLVINNKNYFNNFLEIEQKLHLPSIKLTIKNHLYNILAFISYKLYNVLNIWKAIIFISNKYWFITKILNENEKNCNFNEFELSLPNSLAWIAINELEKIKKYNNHRRYVAEFYNEEIKNKKIKIWFKKLKTEKNNYFRYPVLLNSTKEAKSFYNYMKKHKIILWKTWSFSPIAPLWSNIEKCNFILWKYKNAEKISSRILFLPNYYWINFSKMEYIVKVLNKF